MQPVLNILLVAADEGDHTLIRDLLSDVFGDGFRLVCSSDWKAARRRIDSGEHGLFIFDNRLGGRTGLDLIADTRALGRHEPIILLTDRDDDVDDILALKAGAADYLVKGEISAPLLGRSIRYALERRKAEQELTALAQYDPLTGVANRSRFRSRLADAIAQARRERGPAAVLLLDLDKFKDVNDTLGHPAGDELLKEVARRLCKLVRETDTVARLGGDEFAVIATNLHHERGAAILAGKIVATISRPFRVGREMVFSSASIGIVIIPKDGEDPDQLLKNADLALYEAKTRPGGSLHCFDEGLNRRALARKLMEDSLRSAMVNDEFVLHYQPKIDIASGDVTGVEALLRWNHPKKGLCFPGEFISLAESTGLIFELGDWVVKTACEQCVMWSDLGPKPLSMAVNLSAVQFGRPEVLLRNLRNIIADTGIAPGLLEVEITESTVMKDASTAAGMLGKLRDLGVRVAVDDFGIGHSSLAYLKTFPVDCLKIDQLFIRNLLHDPDDAAITKVIIMLGRSLGLEVVAEGVEEQEQLAFLHRNGCDQAQGFLISKALAPNEFEAWYARYRSSPVRAAG